VNRPGWIFQVTATQPSSAFALGAVNTAAATTVAAIALIA
jgi:hypothetical protein